MSDRTLRALNDAQASTRSATGSMRIHAANPCDLERLGSIRSCAPDLCGIGRGPGWICAVSCGGFVRSSAGICEDLRRDLRSLGLILAEA